MFMFELFTSNFIKEVGDSMFSLSMYGARMYSPAYGDDLTDMTLSPKRLQAVLSLAFI